MAEKTQWEYRVLTTGGSWTGFKVEAAEAALNELGLDGWEVINTMVDPGGYKLVVVAKRPLTEAERRRRNYSE